jgi:hypothetical protein
LGVTKGLTGVIQIVPDFDRSIDSFLGVYRGSYGKKTSNDAGRSVMSQAAEREIGAEVPFWDALDHAGQRDDYQTITEALRVLRGHIEAKGEQ